MSKGNIFTQVPVDRAPRNMFDLSHEVKMSGKFGFLYPVLCIDCVPGDTVRDQMTAMIRFAPMLAPIMHRIDVKTDFFFVPNRLLQTSWENFITGGQDGTLNPSWPFITPVALKAKIGAGALASYIGVGELWDHLGLPPAPPAPDPGAVSTIPVSVMPFKAYHKIFNDYYRDPNVGTPVDIKPALDGLQAVDFVDQKWYLMQRRGWERDYFTSALPWAQRGAQVLMPLSASGFTVKNAVTDPDIKLQKILDGSAAGVGDTKGFAFGGNTVFGDPANTPISMVGQRVDVTNQSITINDFRTSLALQRWLENNARGGGRYNEQILTHFNIQVPDYRLQRAEYLGGGRQPVTISEVLATAETGAVPVGDMAGHGISVGKSNRFTYKCLEHGWIIGIMSITPRTGYSQGIERMWSRPSRYDYAFPEFANLGEQAIISKELFYSFDGVQDGANNGTFGYIPRYAEYKYKNDRIAGSFRTTLDFWHESRIFTSRPALDEFFVTMYENLIAREDTARRIFAVQDGTDYLWVQLYHRLTAKRPLPYFGVPQLRG